MSRSLSKQTQLQLARIADSLSIGQANGQIGKTLAVTSCHKGEGKTAVAASLAAELAGRGQKVLLVEWGTGGEDSFLALLRGGELPAEAPEALAGLVRLPFGGEDPTFAQQGAAMETLLRQLAERYDWVLFALPAYFDHRIAGLVVSRVKDTILVVRYLSTSASDLQQVRSRIERDGGRLSGVVITRYKTYIPRWIANLFNPARPGTHA